MDTLQFIGAGIADSDLDKIGIMLLVLKAIVDVIKGALKK